MEINAARLLTRAVEAGRSEEEVIVEILNLAKHQRYVRGLQRQPNAGLEARH